MHITHLGYPGPGSIITKCYQMLEQHDPQFLGYKVFSSEAAVSKLLQLI